MYYAAGLLSTKSELKVCFPFREDIRHIRGMAREAEQQEKSKTKELIRDEPASPTGAEPGEPEINVDDLPNVLALSAAAALPFAPELSHPSLIRPDR
ncbi:MAG: hypothetical protein LBD85_04695 [Oscillospiraceae bacterium]|jgi:hypothetical protein|nr:hypothetical protein [Oscillospiraceae bacterium]